jgi:heme/copper-type cytochrome/quinol oxidase subunit 1
MTGRRLSEPLAKIHFGMWVVGFSLTFLPQYELGLLGMPRRVADYAAANGWGELNLLSTAGAALLALGVLPLLAAIAVALRRPPDQPADPWGGATLEWWTDSPPPPGNFRNLPPIRSARPVFDARLRATEETGR